MTTSPRSYRSGHTVISRIVGMHKGSSIEIGYGVGEKTEKEAKQKSFDGTFFFVRCLGSSLREPSHAPFVSSRVSIETTSSVSTFPWATPFSSALLGDGRT